MRNRAARIPRSRHQHRQLAIFTANEIAHQSRHESRAKILERQCRPVKKFQNVQSWRKRNQFHWKIDGFAHNLPQQIFRHIRCRERLYHAKTNFRERQRAKFFQFFRRMPRNFSGHIQSAIGRKSAQYRAAQRGKGSLAGCAAVSQREPPRSSATDALRNVARNASAVCGNSRSAATSSVVCASAA